MIRIMYRSGFRAAIPASYSLSVGSSGGSSHIVRNYSSPPVNRFAAQFAAPSKKKDGDSNQQRPRGGANKSGGHHTKSAAGNTNTNKGYGTFRTHSHSHPRSHSHNRHENKGSGGHNRRNHEKKREKPLTFEFETGSDLAKTALKSLIDKVHTINNGKYMVNFVDPLTNKLEKVHLAKVTNALDLAEEGIYIIPASGSADDKTPLVRKNKIVQMIKTYSDEIAAEREKELLSLGSKAAARSQQQRERAEKKKSSTKIITISWEINFADFHNQKKREIQKKIDKRESFVIFIGDRHNLVSARRGVDKTDGLIKKMQGTAEEIQLDNEEHDEEEALEMFVAKNLDVITKAKREKLVNELREFLAESVGKLEVSGTLDRRIVFTCSNIKSSAPVVSPQKNNSLAGDNSELSAKEQRRLKRLQKQQQPGKSNAVVKEEDLDSLYQLKLDD